MDGLLITRGLVFQNTIRYPDLVVAEGKATFLTGPSGCGKSTLLHLMNATLSPSAGQVLYRGQDVAVWDTIQLRREVLLVRQAAFLFDRSIRENFQEFHRYRGGESPGEGEVRNCLELCLAQFPLDQSCATLSGGERQRVFLAVGLSFHPRVLLLDEPTSALDTGTGTALMERLLPYCRENGVTPVVVSHDRGLTERFADVTIALRGEEEP